MATQHNPSSHTLLTLYNWLIFGQCILHILFRDLLIYLQLMVDRLKLDKDNAKSLSSTSILNISHDQYLDIYRTALVYAVPW